MSGVTVLEPRAAGGGVGRPALAVLALTMGGAVFFVMFAALPYFALLFSDAPNQFVDEVRFGLYFPRRGWLLPHIVGGMLAVLAGPVQLWLGLRDRRMEVHRRLGYVYITGMAVGSVGAVGLAVQTPLGMVFGGGLLALAAVWVATTGLAFASIRRGLIEQHKEWMIRSYVTTFAFVTFRIGDLAMTTAGFSDVAQRLGILAWACWAVPLVATEAVLQGRKIFAAAS